jgi:hypothetical protein
MINYETMTDAELSEAVALKCVRWSKSQVMPDVWWNARGKREKHGPNFATSADAVLPLLEKKDFRIERLRLPIEYVVYIELQQGTYFKGGDATFARAACLALLKAADSEKGGAS